MTVTATSGWVGTGLQIRAGCTGIYVRDATDPLRRLVVQPWKWQAFVNAVKRGEITRPS